MVSTVKPFLMFQGDADDAMALYTAQFPDARVENLMRHGPEMPAVEGKVASATLTIAGQTVMINDSVVRHAFTFTPSFSFFVTCDDEAELDRLCAGLGDGGQVFMEPADYGFSRRFTWIGDRFGVSWQLNLP